MPKQPPSEWGGPEPAIGKSNPADPTATTVPEVAAEAGALP